MCTFISSETVIGRAARVLSELEGHLKDAHTSRSSLHLRHHAVKQGHIKYSAAAALITETIYIIVFLFYSSVNKEM